MKQNFFAWYYGAGLALVLRFSGNALRYIPYRFNILPLLFSLFSPWKRDVSPHAWRGFHPLLSLQRFAENAVTRFLGAIVRLSVVFWGLGALLATVLFVPLFLAAFVLAPLLIPGAVLLAGVSLEFAAACGALGLGAVVAAFLFYERDRQFPIPKDAAAAFRSPLRARIWARLGLPPERLREAEAAPERLAGILSEYDATEEMFLSAAILETSFAEALARPRRFWEWENMAKAAPVGRTWQYGYTPHLDEYATDLSRFDPTPYRDEALIGRADELKVATVVLERPEENSVILVGDPGIGKRTLIHTLARGIRENFFAGTFLHNTRVLLFDCARAVGDARSRGEDAEHWLRYLFAEATLAGNIILVIDEIDRYLAEHAEHASLAPVFNEFLAYPSFRVIGTATVSRYHGLMKTSEGSLRSFEAVYLREPTEAETLRILLQEFQAIERERPLFSLQGFRAVLASAERLHWETPFPERAISLAREVLSYQQSEGSGPLLITEPVVHAFVSLKTGMPVGAVGEEEKARLLNLEEALHRRVIGQNEAVKQIAEAMRRARAGLGNDKKPIGSFLFLGPTGVGKTETAKAFAESYFGNADRMIRLDMSEFQGESAVARLIGSEERGETGELTSRVEEDPHSLLLLDEIEKAYPKALDLFLQVLDEGFLTDGFGKKVNFRNTIIVATSNAGATLIRDLLAQRTPLQEAQKQVVDYIVHENLFRLEFLNRFDGVIFFAPLSESELLEVIRLKLGGLADRLLREKRIRILFAPGVEEAILGKGYQPEFGARSLNRFIGDTIEDRIATAILAGGLERGGSLTISPQDI